jgi:hypothetical protein
VELPGEVRLTLLNQDGVIARRQAMALAVTKSDIDRLVRRREWMRVLPGVYVDHTGEPTWLQRAWAGVLYYSPSALAGPSAMRMIAGPGWRAHDDMGHVWLAVDAGRNVAERPGYRVRYLAGFAGQVLHHTHPPRMRFEEACLDVVAATRSELERIQILAGACHSRCTTPDRLLSALAGRSRMPHRAWVAAVLCDVSEGSCSVLEHGYLTKVERPHGLPRASRQTPDTGSTGRIYRDVTYEQFGQHVELDGAMFHSSLEAREADYERDLDAALLGRGTVRLSWGQVFGRPCRTAAKVGFLLARRGWTGPVRRCGPDCQAA